nr:class I SAM-dependent methyltransferase [uncultured Rhodopila sp.]
MGQTAVRFMHGLHHADIYAGFVPTFALDLQGWNSQDPSFERIIAEIRPIVVIDVGVWKGGSTIHLANLLRKYEIDGVVLAVDTFLGSSEHWPGAPFSNLIGRRHGISMLYEQFLANVVRSGAQDLIVPMPQSSEGAAAILAARGVRADLIHIDAAHDYESVRRDARDYWGLLAPGGYLVGDDYVTGWPGVVKAADEFSAEKNTPLVVSGPKWIMRKDA